MVFYFYLEELYYESLGVPTLTSNILFVFLSFFDKIGISSLILKEAPKGLIVPFYTRFELRTLIRSLGGIILKELIKSWRVGFREKFALLRERGKIIFLIQFTDH